MEESSPYDVGDCPRCGNQAVLDFEEHTVYCTGCPLCVHDTDMDTVELVKIWNGIYDDVSSLSTT